MIETALLEPAADAYARMLQALFCLDKRLFNRFGFANIFSEFNRVASRDTKALLTSFNDLRVEMAHVGMPIGLTSGDIRQHITNIRSLVGYIDRVFYNHVGRSIRTNRWTT